jgi:hypothetical protein
MVVVRMKDAIESVKYDGGFATHNITFVNCVRSIINYNSFVDSNQGDAEASSPVRTYRSV